MRILLVLLLCTSCAMTNKKNTSARYDNSGKLQLVEKKQGDKNWQNDFYDHTVFRVKNVEILSKHEELIKLCDELEFRPAGFYGIDLLSKKNFKTKPILIKSDYGFRKKVYVSKGACRELVYFLEPKKEGKKFFRRSIKQMNLLYVYNYGTYLIDIDFETQYPDVIFNVK